ncbi:hypothetical protein BDW02DRAFT_214585 [Decorospora gaudefroyi]|uniref:Uncharacterized protein n=1 Tax=Decorospora gaudefroyi TaxID=184978 RepID=A0A6A5KLC1_9PLEO|nr:hypothetical protein BDW02DRAFT_214585 [Decorospora gaudefroyi]
MIDSYRPFFRQVKARLLACLSVLWEKDTCALGALFLYPRKGTGSSHIKQERCKSTFSPFPTCSPLRWHLRQPHENFLEGW